MQQSTLHLVPHHLAKQCKVLLNLQKTSVFLRQVDLKRAENKKSQLQFVCQKHT